MGPTVVLGAALAITGALGAALVDGTSGMALQTSGSPGLDLELAATCQSTVLQTTLQTVHDLGIHQSIEDILIVLSAQCHIVRPLPQYEGLFLYLVLDRQRANLGMSRFRLTELGNALVM